MSTTAEKADTEATSPQRRPSVTAVVTRIDDRLEARRGLTWVLLALFFAVVATIIVVPAATAPGGVSPIDEYDYTDALDKADRWELSNTGDKIDGYARQVTVCRGLLTVTPASPELCGTPQTDADVPRNGFSASDIHPPTYFFLTAVASKVVRAVGITDDLLIAGRLVGALWLALGMLAMVRLGRAWGAGWVVPALTAVTVGASPLLVSVSGYLTPDALGLLVGAGVLLATTYWQRGRLPLAVLALAALVPAFVKVPFVLAPLFGAAMLLVAALLKHTPWRRALTGAVVLVVGAGAGAVAWQVIRGALAVGVPTLHPDGPPVALSNFAQYFGYYLEVIPVVGAPMPLPPLLLVAVKPLMWLLLATTLGAILFGRRDDPLQPVRWAGVGGMALGSIVISLIVLVAAGGFLIGQARYGIALVPLYVVPLMCSRHPVAVLTLVATSTAALVAHLTLW